MKRFFVIVSVGLGLTVCVSSRVFAQCTSFVYSITTSLSGTVQGPNSAGDLTVKNQKVSNNFLINVTLGNDSSAPVPPNLVLALVSGSNCAEADRLVVWDTLAQSVLSEFAVEQSGTSVATTRDGIVTSATFGELWEIDVVGRWLSGNLFSSTTEKLGELYQVTSGKGTLTGFAKFVGPAQDSEGVVFTKGSLSIKGPPIGIVATSETLDAKAAPAHP